MTAFDAWFLRTSPEPIRRPDEDASDFAYCLTLWWMKRADQRAAWIAAKGLETA